MPDGSDRRRPLSAAQADVWLAPRAGSPSPVYNSGEYVEIRGPVDVPLFESALQRVVMETEALQVRFAEDGDGPYQLIGQPPPWSLLVIDLSAESDSRAAAQAWMRAELAKPADPVRGPLFAYALLILSGDRVLW